MGNKTNTPGLDPRDLWLAGLGVVSLTRKQATKVYGTLVEEGTQFRKDASKRSESLTTQARNGLGEIKAKVNPLLARVDDAYGTVRQEVETRLAPVVNIFSRDKGAGKPKPKAAARKRPAAKPAAKPPVKKATARAATKKAA